MLNNIIYMQNTIYIIQLCTVCIYVSTCNIHIYRSELNLTYYKSKIMYSIYMHYYTATYTIVCCSITGVIIMNKWTN